MTPNASFIRDRRHVTVWVAAAIVLSYALSTAAIVPRKPPPTSAPTGPEPQVELYIPSFTALSDAAQRSRTAEIFAGLRSLMALPENETDEGFDIQAVLKLLGDVASWPDTSLAAAIYTQDREGRPRWCARVDWPLADLRGRVESLLTNEAAKKVLENVAVRAEGKDFVIELPDTKLAMLRAHGSGSLITSAKDVELPEKLFGRSQGGSDESRSPKSLVYCRLNLAARGEDGESSASFLQSFNDIRYIGRLGADRCWREQFSVRWNPLLGAGIKSACRRLRKPIPCPNDGYLTAGLHVVMGGAMADTVSGLPPATIGGRAGSEFALAVVPGRGFLPFPDIYYVFRLKQRSAMLESIRKAIAEDTKTRAEDDRPPAWREESIDGREVFWRDPGAEEAYGLAPVAYRTVIFADSIGDGDAAQEYLIIAETSQWADDAVGRWSDYRARDALVTMPSSERPHWEGRINWRRLYETAQPYLAILASFDGESSLPPSVDELRGALRESHIEVRIAFSGLSIVHTGPIPAGAAYVPGVAVMALSSAADPSSEAAREQTAIRKLRVLHHHAKLFKKDYGRWPATVAELDGYVDFRSHPELLSLQPASKGILAGVLGLAVGSPAEPRVMDDEGEWDDTLYEIEWSRDRWRLKFRAGQFKSLETIAIDEKGEIERVPKRSDGSSKGPVASAKS